VLNYNASVVQKMILRRVLQNTTHAGEKNFHILLCIQQEMFFTPLSLPCTPYVRRMGRRTEAAAADGSLVEAAMEAAHA
jgi:hypothetical protein